MARFLIIDDDPACRRLLENYLKGYNGSCDLAHDGHEGISAFRMALDRGEPYDLICLDIMMPGIDGHHVLDILRQQERERGILGSDGVKVIMTTALMDSKHCIRAFKEGCESYVPKPIREQEFLKQVRLLLGDSSRLSDEPSKESSRPSSPVKPADAADRPGGARYLIVDDDRVCRELLRDILRLYGRCDFAYDGAEATEAVRLALEDGDPYRMICLDIMMPGISGHDALQAIRRVELEHGIGGSDGAKVIMITALRDSKHCIQSFREGCECFLTKPIHEAELLARMRELDILAADDAARPAHDPQPH